MTKTGGREAGTPNKRTQEVIEKLEALSCDPIEGMAQIAQQARKENNLHLAGQMYKELAQYIAPKRKSVELATDYPKNSVEQMTDDELHAALEETRQLVAVLQVEREG